MLLLSERSTRPLILDVGGEGRHPSAWNVNPNRWVTLGPRRGEPIPRWMKGRADLIPLPDHAADLIFVERTPLSRAACHEIRRVVRRGGRVVLRHARPFGRDPHRVARVIFTGTFAERDYVIGAHVCQELVITMDSAEVIVSGDEPPGTGSSCQSSQAQHRDARPAAQPSALRQKN